MMQFVLLVAAGGAIGSMLRFLTVRVVTDWLGGPAFPFGTLTVNAIGCFLIGLFFALGEQRGGLAPEARSLLVTGLLGGFTTFSAFGYETFELIRLGQTPLALGYVAASVVLGLVAVGVGDQVGRALGS